MIRLTQVIVLFGILIGCKKNEEPSIVQKVCDCYSEQNNVGIDQGFTNCLDVFNQKVNQGESEDTNVKEHYESEIIDLTMKLITSCPKYQDDFNKMQLRRYEERAKYLDPALRDSIELHISKNQNLAVNLAMLAEYKIIEDDLEGAMQLVNKGLEINDQIQIGYFVRSFLNHKNGDYQLAIDDLNKIDELNRDDKKLQFAVEISKLNLGMELKKN